MTTAVRTAPLHSLAQGILSVECELTGNCQLECSHCCTLSGPKVAHGSMTLDDWRQVVDDTAALGIPAVQFIGGEPTRSLHLLPLITHALCRDLTVEVYSNLTHIRPGMWAAFEQDGVRLATSYYSDQPAQHDEIPAGAAATSGPGTTSSKPSSGRFPSAPTSSTSPAGSASPRPKPNSGLSE